MRRSFSCTPQEFAEKMEPQFGKVQWCNITHSLHLCCIYLYLPTFNYLKTVGKCKYTIDGWYGLHLWMIGHMSDMIPPKWWWEMEEMLQMALLFLGFGLLMLFFSAEYLSASKCSRSRNWKYKEWSISQAFLLFICRDLWEARPLSLWSKSVRSKSRSSISWDIFASVGCTLAPEMYVIPIET